MILVLVAAAVGALWLARRRPAAIALPLGLAAMAMAAWAGLDLPDLDQQLPLLDHRDAITHSLLPAAIALTRRWLRPLAAGLALGIGLHLSADVFPAAMRGYATVKLPFAGSLGSWSYAWLIANAIAGGVAFVLLIDRRLPPPVRGAMLGGAVLLGILYLQRVDGGWWAMSAFAAAAALFWWVQSGRREPLR